MNTESFFSDLGVNYRTEGPHCTQGWVQLRYCPSCNSDNYHLGFCLRGGFFACWKCGGLNTVFVLKSLGASPAQMREFFQGLDLPKETSRPTGTLQEPKGRGPLLRAHQAYLADRGFDPAKLERLWELEGIGLAGDLSWRIYIPVVQQGKRVSWTTRAIGQRMPRYVSAAAQEESVPHKSCLYGVDYACHSIVVCEGPVDAWRVGPGAVALFGAAFTSQQVRLLSRFPYRYILFDNERSAQRQAYKLAAQLSCFPGTTTVLECDAKDPGELPWREVKRLRRIAGLETI